ncbi:LmbE family N-acetylglucosaminyl deacetylase [Saccharopolyspora erythraea NRRL 2338]|uniref:LmbE family protein n=2 Tax=Saccharopolyspora erythraea TaxID=1836 RepID=A4FP78_SACEN|nr:PIG-L deacetylase family protein [Saccharopolyspora erythraea]EQD84765.1 GlcNAc-PI de-N-acetylase [Saccharopolyspora erythraea D]PFG99495.1 LmbE family N-acetylglucosaminyl deacetylase [Saccharopolyspora erythraea NRRL 2338]QRK89399.1 PIG-L family deacetylase [Saccharopolyspora erythraea]CAM05853.1 LmbE family protein [Saccharopolyspora erythraea NRRL 2338]
MTTAPDSPTGTRRALVVAAHPDDVDFGSAGTVASWTAAGMRVTYCICTNGDAGGFDATARADMPVIRQQEQRAAAAAVGVTDVHFLGYRDGQVSADLQLRRDITRMIRTVRPDRVLTHSPEINWARIAMSHPDHRAVGEATLAAVYPDARNEFAHPDLLLQHGLRPWLVPELWMSEAPDERANRAVDITDHFEAKLAALSAHRSQTGHLDDLEGSIRRHLARTAERHGMTVGRLAEAFHVVDTS